MAATKITKLQDKPLLACEFLSDYASYLLGCGATCIRIEKNVGRMAEAWQQKVVMTIMPHHIHMSVVGDDGTNAITVIKPIKNHLISYDINTLLSRLSWEVVDDKLKLAEAKNKFDSIVHTKPANKWWVLFAVTLANASFCSLFGGDSIAMAIVALATFCGYYMKQILLELKMDIRIVFMVCAFLSTVLGATDKLFHLGSTPDIAIGTSVLYLVPGIPFLNSFSDMLDSHYLCSFSRLMWAVVLTFSLSIGLCAGMLLMKIGMF